MDAPRRILFTQVSHQSYNEAHFGWRSPLVYLFVAVAAMLFIVGFASFILVCTWCRLANDHMRANSNTRQPDAVSPDSGPLKPQAILVEDEEQGGNMLVIMPGDQKPSFVATQVPSAPHVAENRG
ncbi:hypothetical protein SUGI_0896250 [Cryptomeria japonica]|uniref:protein GLUTAMINE DUMPER 3 n=1 Tax=Cryptomeria japonica TaxID=3369 RepID=UPI002414C975|nr:protein GLUTAMINE DUMPER 3 [Cryptomeria japonica]GLJ43170.1 hypothetical protein SUGI_0896250 [Cryptomeria japonica]